MSVDFTQSAPQLAEQLIGYQLIRSVNGQQVGGVIIETEAYAAHDPASHSFKGPTKRNQPMFGPPGHLYIYFTYGMYYCMNFVCGNNDGQAVLLRGLEPTVGIETMKQRRGKPELHQLASGPAKLVIALGIGPEHNGQTLTKAGISLQAPVRPPAVVASSRIGISKAVDTPWRFTKA